MRIVKRTINSLPPLDSERINNLKQLKDKDIDVSDMPPLTEEQLARLVPAKLLNRSLYKPVKIPIKVNYDADIIEWFRSFGKGYQTKMNAALREYMMEHFAKNK
ncbi:BrnA antitoxin family protein [Treponema primitia]|uniref:BrnA antitoxin family protein n=1 Tax=Treponema primitia TaxID=88058 RepID=UPI0039818353